MSQRYDRKRWYVQPTDAHYEEARRQNETASTSKSAPAKPLTLLVGSNVPPLSVHSDKVIVQCSKLHRLQLALLLRVYCCNSSSKGISSPYSWVLSWLRFALVL